MNDIVLFLILQIWQYQGCVTLPVIMFTILGTYISAQFPFWEEIVSLAPVNMCRIRNRTILLVIKETGSTGVGPINIFGSNKGLRVRHLPFYQKLLT